MVSVIGPLALVVDSRNIGLGAPQTTSGRRLDPCFATLIIIHKPLTVSDRSKLLLKLIFLVLMQT